MQQMRDNLLTGVIIPQAQSGEAGTGPAVRLPPLLTQPWGTEGSRREVSACHSPEQRPWRENSHQWSPGFSVQQNGTEAPAPVGLGCICNKSTGVVLLVRSGDHTLRTTRWKGGHRDRSVISLPLPGLLCPHTKQDMSALQAVLKVNAQTSAGHTSLDEAPAPPSAPCVPLDSLSPTLSLNFLICTVGRRTRLCADKRGAV